MDNSNRCLADYVNRQLAELLREHGYHWSKIIPTLYEIQKWFRDEHHIEVSANWDTEEQKWFYFAQKMSNYAPDAVDLYSKSAFKTYEEALNTGLIEAINKLI